MLADILGYNIKNPTQVGKLSVDIVKSFEYQYDQEVTGHPVETGFNIADHIVNKPLKLTMTVGLATAPVTWFWRNGIGQKKFANGLKLLEEIRDKKQPITIVRPEKKYDDMVLTSCRVTKQDTTKSVIYVDLNFQKIVKVTTQTTEIPKDIVTASKEEDVGKTAASVGDSTTATAASVGDSTTATAASVGGDVGGDFGSGLPDETVSNKTWLASGVDNIKSALGIGV